MPLAPTSEISFPAAKFKFRFSAMIRFSPLEWYPMLKFVVDNIFVVSSNLLNNYGIISTGIVIAEANIVAVIEWIIIIAIGAVGIVHG